MIGPLLITVKIAFQHVGKEKKPENGKHDKKFNQDNTPQFPAPGHFPEAIHIEIENFFEH
jgi:hypothetical protein